MGQNENKHIPKNTQVLKKDASDAIKRLRDMQTQLEERETQLQRRIEQCSQDAKVWGGCSSSSEEDRNEDSEGDSSGRDSVRSESQGVEDIVIAVRGAGVAEAVATGEGAVERKYSNWGGGRGRQGAVSSGAAVALAVDASSAIHSQIDTSLSTPQINHCLPVHSGSESKYDVRCFEPEVEPSQALLTAAKAAEERRVKAEKTEQLKQARQDRLRQQLSCNTMASQHNGNGNSGSDSSVPAVGSNHSSNRSNHSSSSDNKSHANSTQEDRLRQFRLNLEEQT